jgi:hypothetical protein
MTRPRPVEGKAGPRKPLTIVRDLDRLIEHLDDTGFVVETKEYRRLLAELRRSLRAQDTKGTK